MNDDDDRGSFRRWLSRPVGAAVAIVAGIAVVFGICAAGFHTAAGYLNCAHPRPAHLTAHDLVGTYHGAHHTAIKLFAQGDAITPALAADDIGRTIPAGDTDWQLLPTSDDYHGGDVEVSDAENADAYLRVTGSRSDPMLYQYIGEAEECHLLEFKRS